MLHTIPYFFTVTAGNRVTSASNLIAYPYIIQEIRVKYALGHAGAVQHSFFVSDDKEIPTTGPPTGLDILGQYGPVDYVVGDDDVAIIKENTIIDRMGTWFKVHAYNTDPFDHTVNVIITIDDMRIHPAFRHLADLLKEFFERGAAGT